MKDNTYLVPRNAPCPVCRGIIKGTESGLFFVCADCGRIYRDASPDLKFGSEHDRLLQCLNEKRISHDEC